MNIFIDTSIFISSNFNVNSSVFSSLQSLCSAGHVRLILTDITIEEIKSNLSKPIREAESAIKKARTKARVLRNVKSDGYQFLFGEMNKEEIYSKIYAQLSKFCQDCNATILNAMEIPAKPIFEDYFQCNPPFGEGKKKSEFPDAFVISAIIAWCESNKDTVYTVSSDPDFKNASMQNDYLEYLPSIAKFIEIRLADENILVGVIHDHMKQQKNRIFEAVADQIKEYEMIVQDADFDAEAFIEEVSIIDMNDASIINISDNKATIEASILAYLNVDVNCYDPDSWYKDPEDKTIHYWDKIEDVFEREEYVEIEFDIFFDKTNIQNFKVTRVLVNKGNQLSFYLNNYDEY